MMNKTILSIYFQRYYYRQQQQQQKNFKKINVPSIHFKWLIHYGIYWCLTY